MPFKKGHKNQWRKSTASTRTSTPRHRDESDQDMPDAEPEMDNTHLDDDLDDVDTPAQGDDDRDEEDDEEEDEDEDGEPTVRAIPRKRGARGSRRSAARDTPDPDDGSDVGTPFSRRRKGRASTGSARPAARGRKKGPPQDLPYVLVEGEKYDVEHDEAILDNDDEGDTKVDQNGVLLGGREYRVRTFKIIDRGDRLYMLSTEPARCCGFRDSYLFFTKHPKLYKVLLTEPEKMDLIGREILPNSYKGRNIGVVTARSVFREFGARIIVGGRRVTDDYKVAEARQEGVMEGTLADPEDRVPIGSQEGYNRNRYVAWFGASDVYRTQAATVPDKARVATKRRNNVTIANWQSLHAKEASKFNSLISAARKTTHNGIYDNNTNLMFYPSITQPTHARWESVTDEKTSDTIFKPLPELINKNFAVIDTTYISPLVANGGYPGPDGVITDPFAGSTGLSSIAPELIDELPAECRTAFLAAKETELQWKQQWSTEAQANGRSALKINLTGYPV